MDDLEVNPLYRAFLTRFRREFEIACKMSYLIAIPTSDSLENSEIDQHFANSHILIPSKLLRMHYHQLQAGNFDHIETEGKRLVCYQSAKDSRGRLTVKIIAEEIGYNVLNREYRTVLIEQPIICSQVRPMGLSLMHILSPLTPRSPQALAKQRRAHLIGARTLTHHDDCAKYLEFVSQRLTLELESEVKRLQSNYIILSHYLPDAAERVRALSENYIERYALAVSSNGQLEVCDTIRRSIRLSVENYLVYLMHGKLLPAALVLYERQDRQLESNYHRMETLKFTICQLGAQQDFSNFSPDEELMRLFRRLPTLQSPLAMISCLTKLVDLISCSLDQSVRLKQLLGDSSRELQRAGADKLSYSQVSPVLICSDDLIASFVICLARARPVNLFSAVKYLDMFGWSSVERDQAAYYSATLESAIEYIANFEAQLKSEPMRGESAAQSAATQMDTIS